MAPQSLHLWWWWWWGVHKISTVILIFKRFSALTPPCGILLLTVFLIPSNRYRHFCLRMCYVCRLWSPYYTKKKITFQPHFTMTTYQAGQKASFSWDVVTLCFVLLLFSWFQHLVVTMAVHSVSVRLWYNSLRKHKWIMCLPVQHCIVIIHLPPCSTLKSSQPEMPLCAVKHMTYLQESICKIRADGRLFFSFFLY